MNNFNYPAGAFADPNAPYNQDFAECDECGEEMETGFIDDCGTCFECIENADKDSYCEIET
ncbi:MAG: hypothetical protein CL885_04105 [Dehalococcoidia bacterium]|nr:hypothetical protein [Dehalococcoidia bacterium]|tara:strand:+ start:355 stop:537 length:183 start_codon:yes stop_codon:yes gene_type:complete